MIKPDYLGTYPSTPKYFLFLLSYYLYVRTTLHQKLEVYPSCLNFNDLRQEKWALIFLQKSHKALSPCRMHHVPLHQRKADSLSKYSCATAAFLREDTAWSQSQHTRLYNTMGAIVMQIRIVTIMPRGVILFASTEATTSESHVVLDCYRLKLQYAAVPH